MTLTRLHERILTVTLAAMLTACSSIHLKYTAQMTADNVTREVAAERSYSIQSTQTLCIITGVLYGGWCWAYLFMPTRSQIATMAGDSRVLLKGNRESGRYSFARERVQRVGWKKREPTSNIGDRDTSKGPQGPSNSHIEKSRQFIISQFEKGKLYAGPDLSDAKSGMPIKLVDFQIHPPKDDDLITATLHFEQEGKTFSLEIEMEFTPEGQMQKNGLFSVASGRAALDAIYTKDPISKYRGNSRIVQAVRDGKVFIGMPADAARIALGKPERTNSTVTTHRRREQWVYSSEFYVYVEGGQVVGFQSSE